MDAEAALAYLDELEALGGFSDADISVGSSSGDGGSDSDGDKSSAVSTEDLREENNDDAGESGRGEHMDIDYRSADEDRLPDSGASRQDSEINLGGCGHGRGRRRGRGQSGGRGRSASCRRGAGRGRGRGVGRGHARGRGVGRGQGHTFAFHDAVDECEEATFGWDDDDNVSGQPPHFHPNRPAGLNLLPGFAPQCELDFFRLYFSSGVVRRLADSTNLYAWQHIADCPTYGDRLGAWVDTTADEMDKCLALILYMSLVKMPRVKDYWKTTSLFHGSWARAMVKSRTRFLAHVFSPCVGSS